MVREWLRTDRVDKNIIIKQIDFKDTLSNRFINYEINFAINTEDKYILQQYIIA